MKVSDFVYEHEKPGYLDLNLICRVRNYVTSRGEIFTVLTDLGDKNPNSSVTNLVEQIRLSLIDKGHIAETSRIIENYDRDPYSLSSFDLVTFSTDNTPSWQKTNIELICNMLECSSEEFSTPSLEIQRIYDEAERLRHGMNPHVDEPWPESFELINRREDIQSKHLAPGSLQAAIDKKASETEIRELLIQDLSILGQFYSHPTEEYICFAEFPIGDGFVDFVVFSGRSRMDVTLIEIKGANYNLINGNSYQDFSAKTNQAVQQVRRRLGYITRNSREFWQFVHKVREDVESGVSRYKSFVGPKTELLVDPQKDINLHTVVIGGKSKDDINESRLRHEYERGNSPSIRIESWDSWIKKSDRK